MTRSRASRRSPDRTRSRLLAAIRPCSRVELEPLEDRRLLSASLHDGLLSVRDGGTHDAIQVALNGTQINVTSAGGPSAFAASDVSKVVTHGTTKGDRVIVTGSLASNFVTITPEAGNRNRLDLDVDGVLTTLRAKQSHDYVIPGVNGSEQIIIKNAHHSLATITLGSNSTIAPPNGVVTPATAASYTVTTGPIQINQGTATLYTVTLAAGVDPPSAVTVNVTGPGYFDFSNASNLTATSLTLTNTSRSASFYFTATNPGANSSLTFTNNGGLTNPTPYTIWVNDLRDTGGFPIYQTIANGNWSSPSTWEGGLIPGMSAATQNADVLIYNNVTLDQNATIGTAPYVQTALEIANVGKLTVNSGVTLTVRGDVIQAAPTNSSSITSCVFNSGSSLLFDTSQLLSGSTTPLYWEVGNGAQYHNQTNLQMNGTAAAPISVSSTGPLFGRFGGVGFSSVDGAMQATYTNFNNIGGVVGSTKYLGIEVDLAANSEANVVFSITHCQFNNSGEISLVSSDNTEGGTVGDGTDSYIVDNNAFVNGQGTYDVEFAGSTRSTGTWDVSSDNMSKGLHLVNTNGLTDTGNTTTNVTGYTVTGPSHGAFDTYNTFTVALSGAGNLPAGVTVTPHLLSGSGSLSGGVTLSNTTRSATFTYYPAANSGPAIISFTDSAGNLVDPQSLNFTPNAVGLTMVQSPSVGTVGCPTSQFKVSIWPLGDYSGNVVVTPNDNGGGGTFSPTSFTLSSSVPTGTFTYTPTSTGSKTVTTANNVGWGNLNNNVTVSAATAAPTSFTLSAPANGQIELPTSNFTVTLGSGSVTGNDVFTPSASNGDGYFTPATLTLTNATRSGTFTYTPLTIGSRTITVNDNVGLAAKTATFVGEVQIGNGELSPSGVRQPDTTGFNWFTNGYLPVFAANAQSEAIDPNSSSIISNFNSLNFHLEVYAETDSAEGGSQLQGYPISIVPQSQPLVPVIIGSGYNDPGPAPIPPNLSVEGYYSATVPEPTSDANGDQHGLVAVRNDSTGGISDLWEMEPAFESGGEGGEWSSTSSLSHFNIATGAQRNDGGTSSAQSGTPLTPLLLTYSEVAQAQASDNHLGVGHVLEFVIPQSEIVNKTDVFPAKVGTFIGGAAQNTGLDEGAVLRLSSSWYNANAASYTGQARVVINTLYRNGMMLTDGSPGNYFGIKGTSDERWDESSITSLNSIGATDFQVVQEIPVWTITGPTSGAVGVPEVFTWQRTQYTPPLQNSSNSMGLTVTPGTGNGAWSGKDGQGNGFGYFHVTDTNQSGFFTFTPTSAGTMTLGWTQTGTTWLVSPSILFTAT